MDSPNVALFAHERDQRVAEKLQRELGPQICEFLKAPDVVEIAKNPDGALWVERLGHPMERFGYMQPHQAESIIGTVASVYKTTVTRDNPILECELPFDGSRFEALIPPVVLSPTFAIRRKALSVFTLDDYVSKNIMTSAQRDAIRCAVDEHKNILVVGGTGTGKTTLTNAIIDYMSRSHPDERLVIIEDTAELQCSSPNYVALRAVDQVDMLRLLKATMRLRPTRILVGEVRGPEALTLIDSWNTGHPGGVATVHANTASTGLTRVESLVRRGVTGAIPVKEIAAAINLVVSIAKVGKGRAVQEVLAVDGYDHLTKNYVLRDATISSTTDNKE
jgi:P-type conjugative transfer ATPase TrbB